LVTHPIHEDSFRMPTTLETLGTLERRLNVAVPIADVEGEVRKRLARLARTVKMAGFRPGKAPLRMLDQQYGPQVRSEVITERVQTSFNDAVREQNLRVAGTPRIEPHRGDQPAPDALEFSAIFEIYKTRSEQFLNANGRDWKAMYKAYTDAVKAKKAAAAKPSP